MTIRSAAGRIRNVRCRNVLLISLAMVTLDLLITRYGLSLPGIVEMNPLGNIPPIEYPVYLLLTYSFYRFERKFNTGHYVSFSFSVLPITLVANNVWVIIHHL